MAENFNPILPDVGIGGGVRFNTPSVDSTTGNAFRAVAQVLDTGLDYFTAAQKAQAAADKSKGISAYASEVGKLQAGYEQGKLSRTQLDAQRRQVFREYSVRHPDDIAEFGQIEKQMFGYSSNSKEEAVVEAGQKQTQTALQKGWEILGTDASEADALQAGNKRMQHEYNIDFAMRQLDLATKTQSLDSNIQKQKQEKATDGVVVAVNGSVNDQAYVMMQKVLQMPTNEIQQNTGQLSQDIARLRAFMSMQLGQAFSQAGQQGVTLAPEARKQMIDNLNMQMDNIEAYIQSPTEAMKKSIENLEILTKGNLDKMSPEFAQLRILGPVVGPNLVGYMVEQQRSGLLSQLTGDASRAMALARQTLEGKVNLEALTPPERRVSVGALNSVMQAPNMAQSTEPDKDSSTFMKALKTFTGQLPKAPLTDQLGIIDSITTPQFMANLDTAIKQGKTVDLTGIPEAVTTARSILQQEITRQINSQNPTAYGQNVLGINPTADANGNISVNLEPPETVSARHPVDGVGMPSFINGRTAAGGADLGGIQPTPEVAQIQKTVDTFNKLNTVLRMLGTGNSSGPSGTAGPASSSLVGSKGADNMLLNSVRQVESGGNNKAVSPKGALGSFQVMPDTAKNPGYGIKPLEDPSDPKEARRFATEYLTAMKQEFNGNPYLAVLAYNAGPGPVRKWMEGKGDLPQETIDYGRKIMRELGGM
jgi:uncharacterized protein YggU (UPF0235/DUF167 family)